MGAGMRRIKRMPVIVLAQTALALLGVACAPAAQEAGTLQGQVTIGPLVPVVQAGSPEPTPGPEIYAARQIVILDESGRQEVARVSIDQTGSYKVALEPGNYVVDINHAGIDLAKGLPAPVEITSGRVTRLDVEIDTGIR